MFVELRKSVGRNLEVAAEVMAMLASASGTAVALVLGKALLAIALGAIALGLCLRFTGRRKTKQIQSEVPVPWWVSGLVAAASVIEGAVLVEAANIPVRFSQSGFALYHWVLVIAFLVVAYFARRRLFGRLFKKHALPPAR